VFAEIGDKPKDSCLKSRTPSLRRFSKHAQSRTREIGVCSGFKVFKSNMIWVGMFVMLKLRDLSKAIKDNT
jgi:phosphoribosylformylglycinamidine (FGAM) synthase-like amidotransferase family enzyme